MRSFIVALALTAGMPAVAAELTVTMQRAAYCSGVLNFYLEREKANATPPPDNVCLGWREQHFASREACLVDLRDKSLASFKAKKKRYDDYLNSELMQRILLRSQDGTDEMMSIALIRGKGHRDAQTMSRATNTTPVVSRILQCEQQCETKLDECTINCVAQQHPTEASAMRCALLPDELPY
jgi:hypothetical protein